MEQSEGGKPAHSEEKGKVTITLRREHLFYIIAIALFAIGFGAGFFMGSHGKEAPAARQAPSQQPPEAIQASIGDAYVKGDDAAEVTIIEFSDFQCPFCGKFYSETLPEIEKNFIDTGKAKMAYKHFPLSFHEMAEPAAQAAECAGEQGKFWEYHDKLFSNQALLSQENLKSWASDLGLDTEQFNSCFDSGKYSDKIQADIAEGSKLGISGTPSFLIGNDKNGYTKVVGAQPYSVFEGAISAALG